MINQDKLIGLIQKNGMIIVMSGLFILSVIFFYFIGQPSSVKTRKKLSNQVSVISEDVDQKAYIARLEKNYFDTQEMLKELQQQIVALNQAQQSAKKSLSDSDIKNQIDKAISQRLLVDQSDKHGRHRSAYTLSVADLAPLKGPDGLYIPLGSFCKGTLLTGVYAFADQSNPLPVLIRIDEAFIGPNQRKLSIKGAYALGKAYGDLVSQRVLVEVIAISTILDDGTVIEREMDLGYLTDKQGELGIRGKLIHQTGKQLAMGFFSGFAAGAADGLADGYVTTKETAEGTIIKSVTGNVSKKALFDGLAKSTGDLSAYFSKRAQDLVPAIYVKNGQEVYFILQKGVNINASNHLANNQL
jgi:hypothetical protein